MEYKIENVVVIEIKPQMPEHARVKFECSGNQGGDSSYGGCASLTLSMAAGLGFEVDPVEGNCSYDQGSVVISCSGDWEMNGLVSALINLGDMLKVVCSPVEHSNG